MQEPTNTEIMSEVKAIKSHTSDIRKILYGNGHPGLIKTVENSRIWIKSRQWFERLFIGGCVLTAIPSIGAVVYWAIIHKSNNP